jgi:hypothetical protein
MARTLLFLLALTLLLTTSCGGTEGVGTVRVSLSGEEASREGFPVGDIAFADGWSLQFERVIVSLVDFRLAASDGDEAMIEADPIVADLHLGEPIAWTFEGVHAQRWDRVSYHFGAPTAASRKVGVVDDATLASMIANRHALHLEGVATRGDERVPFAFGLDLNVDATRCEGADETEGLVVREATFDDAQLTIHLDHLFFDSYATDEPAMRFDPMAAVVGDDGRLTLDDLAAQSTTDVRDANGEPLLVDGAPLVYDPGDLPLDAPNLRDFVRAAAITIGHFQGEGHCDYARR